MTRAEQVLAAAAAGSVLAATPAIATDALHIDAGANQSVSLAAPAMLSGLVSKAASIGWMKVDGPGEVVFARPHAAVTEASFSQAGEYTLMLGGFDGHVAYDTVRVTVLP